MFHNSTIYYFISGLRAYLCDILSWKDRIPNVSCTRCWCQYSARWEVGEVGLYLWQWGCWHNKSLLGLTSSNSLGSWVDRFGHHLGRKRDVNEIIVLLIQKALLLEHFITVLKPLFLPPSQTKSGIYLLHLAHLFHSLCWHYGNRHPHRGCIHYHWLR